MTSRTRFDPMDVGWIAAGLGLASALAFGFIRGANAEGVGPRPSGASIIAFSALLGGPAIVGAIGAANRRRDVVVGAGLAYVPLAMLSFSGVTLFFLIPALLFLYSGLRVPDGVGHPARRTDRPAIALAIVGLLTAGVVGLFATVGAVCWEQTADGTIRQREVPAGEISGAYGEVTVGTGEVVASGCSGGVISTTGAVIVLVCAATAVGLAAGVGRTRD